MHDGSVIHLRKVRDDWRTDDRAAALAALQASNDSGGYLTGLLYLDPNAQDLMQTLNLASRPLNTLGKDELCPGNRVLKSINEGLR